MKLTQNDLNRLRSWKEGERFNGEGEPVLPRVCLDIVSRHARKPKSARGKLRAAAQAIQLVLAVLDDCAGHRDRH